MKDTAHRPGRVLVANRGEIACRIVRTLDRLGIASVAVHHSVERNARHVRMAGTAVELSGATPVAAHLDAAQIVAAAREAGADAVHPGYGFLSENAAFAQAVQEAGLAWIGPRPETIELMGDKIRARGFAAEHGVPVAPSAPITGDPDALAAEAATIGYPLLIKAAAGGGGKGMSIVREPAELAEKAARAAHEAERYFADGRIYAERYIDRPRHVEVQVFGDGAGGAIHLFERECSIQRRFQKVIEEAPAPALDDTLRAEIREAALRLARAARYANAGTVEFILAPGGAFYFLEMNTRLQVEHPVTEMITGRDLVELQLAIAGGERLPAQEEIVARGHAIEARICAEDPETGFLPETGRVLRLQAPAGRSVRFESGLTDGDAVTSDFDPMLAKLVVHGESRDAAISAMTAALGDTILLGVQTNVDFLARVVAHPAFARADLHTGFIDQHAADLREPPLDADETMAAIVAAALSDPDIVRLIRDVPEPYASMGAWRNAG